MVGVNTKRNQQEKSAHDQAVAAIKLARFGFPNAQRPNWRVAINEPSITRWVNAKSGKVYPDIVVWDSTTQDESAVMLGEVETASTVNAQEVAQWSEYSQLVPEFFLYVPVGYGVVARRLASGVAIRGYREWSFLPNGTINVVNC